MQVIYDWKFKKTAAKREVEVSFAIPESEKNSSNNSSYSHYSRSKGSSKKSDSVINYVDEEIDEEGGIEKQLELSLMSEL